MKNNVYKGHIHLFMTICIIGFLSFFKLSNCVYGEEITLSQNEIVNEKVDEKDEEEFASELESSAQTPRDFVIRMYRVALNREPESVGLNDWTNQLVQMTSDGASLARGFIGSAEFQNRNLSNDAYVDVLYRTFFNREGDLAGRNYWINQLNSGIGRMEVLSGFVNSTEFGNLCSLFGIARGTMEKDGSNIFNKDVRAFVCRGYREVLSREGELEGIEYWAHGINYNLFAPKACMESFFHSQEYINRHQNNADYVETLYRAFMGRKSDAGGKASWVEKLNAGMSRDEVMKGFSDSQEFKNIMLSYGLIDKTKIMKSYPFIDHPVCKNSSFRIPALVTLDDGSVVAAADARWNENHDGGGADTVVSITQDYGETWNTDFANYLGDNGNVFSLRSTAFLDPCLATDGKTIYMVVTVFPSGVSFVGNGMTAPERTTGFDSKGRLLLRENGWTYCNYYLENGSIYSLDGIKVPGYQVDQNLTITGNGVNSNLLFMKTSPYSVLPCQYLYMKKSVDGGKTWIDGRMINVKRSGEHAYSVAGGSGLVMSDGTIVFPSFRTVGGGQWAGFIYSMDGGQSFIRTDDATLTAHHSSEGAVVELDANTIRLFFRDGNSELSYTDYTRSNGRFYISGRGVLRGIEKTRFNQLNVVKYDNHTLLITCAASGTLERKEGIIATINLGADRKMSIRNIYSVNGDEYYGYSCITKMKHGVVGLLYEYYSDEHKTKIVFQRIPATKLGL